MNFHSSAYRSGLKASLCGAILLGLGLTLLAPPAQAQEKEKPKFSPEDGRSPWEIDPNNPVKSLPPQEEANKNPLGYGYMLMELADHAEVAEKAQDWAKARPFYEAIIKGAPNRAVGYQKVCEMDRKLEDFPAALESCFAVLSREGVEVRDFIFYVKVVTMAPTNLGSKYRDKALNAMDHFEKKHPVEAMMGRCMLGVGFADQAMLELCVPALQEAEKKSGKPTFDTATFAWSLEMMKKDWSEAQSWLDRVGELAKTPKEQAQVASMQQLLSEQLDSDSQDRWKLLRRGALGLAVLGLVLYWRRRRSSSAA